MWNKWAELLQDPSYKRLALALIISTLLHFFLMNGLDLTMPSLKKELHTIEARLQMPKAAVKELVKEVAPAEEEVTPEPAEPVKEEPPIEELPEPIEQASPEANVEAPSEPVPEPPVEAPAPEVIAETPPTIEPPQRDPQPVDAGLVINENAYRYVETNFDVKIRLDETDFKAKASIVYNLGIENQYNLKFLTEPKGLLALGASELLQTSQGALTTAGLQPLSYLYQYGDKADKTRIANFDWQAKKVTSQTSKETKVDDLPEGAQDLLSFMYQFMYVAPLQKMEIPIATGKKLNIYDYSFEGEANISTELGELKTLHISNSGIDSDERTDLWLALDYQYVPVKIRIVEKNGNVWDFTANRINTNRPVQPE